MEIEELICEQCNSHWQRSKARGRKPKLCPTCLTSSTPVAVVEEEDEQLEEVPLLEEGPPPPTKFKANSRWQCPSCKAKIKVGVGIDEPPVHKCPKRANRVLPLEQL